LLKARFQKKIKIIFKENSQSSLPPLISIITVVKNNKSFIEDAIQSVLSQTYPHIEYIVIDGSSTDGTIDIIQKYK
jgi:glycosyltransferase involved in cell wall biosynthesis